MKIEIINFSYKGTGSTRQLVIELNIEGSKTVQSTAVVIDIFNASYFAERILKVYSGLLLLSAEVYAIDRALSRKVDSINGWSRELDVLFKIPEAEQFQTNVSLINSLLSFLTGDYWTCQFEECPEIEWIHLEDSNIYDNVSQVNLFSGGMDSLIGAIDYMESHDNQHQVFLASHHDSIMKGPKIDQERVITEFKQTYSDRFIYLHPEGITPTISKELTCRSRSLMFLSIAFMVAAYKSCKVIVPENGSVSLNFPLSVSRRAACSTRTTHPLFLDSVRELLSALSLPIIIENPYEFKTKGEMVENCLNRTFMLSVVDKCNSCGKRGGHQFMPDNMHASHCGRCMPCMYRKASMIKYHDSTPYGIKMGNLFLQPKKISNDFYAMLNYLKRNLSKDDIVKELNIMGLKKSHPNFDDYVNLVERTRLELKTLIVAEGTDAIKQYTKVNDN